MSELNFIGLRKRLAEVSSPSRAASDVRKSLAGPAGQRTPSQVSDAAEGHRGAGTSKKGRSGNPNRFAAFAAACEPDPALANLASPGPGHSAPPVNQVSAAHGGRAAAIRQGVGQGYRADETVAAERDEAAAVARQVLRAHAKAVAPTGSAEAAKPASVPYSRVHGLCGKARETNRTEAAKLGADAVATAKRLGAIK